MKPSTLRILTVFALVAIGAAAAVALNTPAPPDVARAVAPVSDCGTVSCTTHLPLVLSSPPLAPLSLEVTQAVQQPDNSVVLIADRPTFARLTLTSTVSHAGVNAWLYGTRGGADLPGSPIAAINNPRTLKTTADRATLGDTFNFELPTSWASGNISLRAEAGNGSTYSYTSESLGVQFTQADPLNVTIIPIAYTCNSGGSGTTTPTGPFDYVTDFTYRIYPVPSVARVDSAAPIPYSGPCNSSGEPTPDYDAGDWHYMYYAVRNAWIAAGRPNNYYYGLVDIDCSGGCVAGLGSVGGYKAAVGFDGFGSQHAYAGVTHAHEVGHNHNREHAPGCGAAGPDPSYPYVSGGKGTIGSSANPNFGFDIDSPSIYPYAFYYDIMGYCNPVWVSDYTYEALLAWSQTQADLPDTSPRGRAFLVSGSMDAAGAVTFQPVYALDASITPSVGGDYVLELLDAGGTVIAVHPFQPTLVEVDWWEGESSQFRDFYLAVPYIEGVASIRVRHGGDILGEIESVDASPR